MNSLIVSNVATNIKRKKYSFLFDVNQKGEREYFLNIHAKFSIQTKLAIETSPSIKIRVLPLE